MTGLARSGGTGTAARCREEAPGLGPAWVLVRQLAEQTAPERPSRGQSNSWWGGRVLSRTHLCYSHSWCQAASGTLPCGWPWKKGSGCVGAGNAGGAVLTLAWGRRTREAIVQFGVFPLGLFPGL